MGRMSILLVACVYVVVFVVCLWIYKWGRSGKWL